MTEQFKTVRTEMKDEFTSVRGEIKAGFDSLQRLMIWGGSGLLFAVIAAAKV